jgi:hypothetical protein
MTMSEAIRPEGKIVSVVENENPLDLNTLKAKSATFAWEFMFTRSMFTTPDMQQQHELLNKVASLVDAGKLRTTLTETLTPINASNLRDCPCSARVRAHDWETSRGWLAALIIVERFPRVRSHFTSDT